MSNFPGYIRFMTQPNPFITFIVAIKKSACLKIWTCSRIEGWAAIESATKSFSSMANNGAGKRAKARTRYSPLQRIDCCSKAPHIDVVDKPCLFFLRNHRIRPKACSLLSTYVPCTVDKNIGFKNLLADLRLTRCQEHLFSDWKYTIRQCFFNKFNYFCEFFNATC